MIPGALHSCDPQLFFDGKGARANRIGRSRGSQSLNLESLVPTLRFPGSRFRFPVPRWRWEDYLSLPTWIHLPQSVYKPTRDDKQTLHLCRQLVVKGSFVQPQCPLSTRGQGVSVLVDLRTSPILLKPSEVLEIPNKIIHCAQALPTDQFEPSGSLTEFLSQIRTRYASTLGSDSQCLREQAQIDEVANVPSSRLIPHFVSECQFLLIHMAMRLSSAGIARPAADAPTRRPRCPHQALRIHLIAHLSNTDLLRKQVSRSGWPPPGTVTDTLSRRRTSSLGSRELWSGYMRVTKPSIFHCSVGASQGKTRALIA